MVSPLKRFFAWFIDMFLVGALSFAVFRLLYVITTTTVQGIITFIIALLVLVFYFAYIPSRNNGKTLGRMLTNSKLIVKGNKDSLIPYIVRDIVINIFLYALFSIFFIIINIILVLSGKGSIADKFTGSKVVED